MAIKKMIEDAICELGGEVRYSEDFEGVIFANNALNNRFGQKLIFSIIGNEILVKFTCELFMCFNLEEYDELEMKLDKKKMKKVLAKFKQKELKYNLSKSFPIAEVKWECDNLNYNEIKTRYKKICEELRYNFILLEKYFSKVDYEDFIYNVTDHYDHALYSFGYPYGITHYLRDMDYYVDFDVLKDGNLKVTFTFDTKGKSINENVLTSFEESAKNKLFLKYGFVDRELIAEGKLEVCRYKKEEVMLQEAIKDFECYFKEFDVCLLTLFEK